MVRLGIRIALLGVGLAILLGIIWLADPVALYGYLIKSDLRYVALAIISTSFLALLRVLKWKVLLRGVGFLELFPVQLLGTAISNLTPGKIGEPGKALILKMRKGIDVSASLPSIIWERIADVVALIGLAFIAIQLIGEGSRVLTLSFLSIGAFIVMIIVLIVALYNQRLGNAFLRFFRRLPILNRIDKHFLDAFYRVKTRKRGLLACFLITGFVWTFEGVTMYLCFLAIGIETTPLLLSGIIALSLLIGIVSSLPGGLGSTDAVMVILLGLAGIEPTIATAGMLLYRLVSFWYGIFIGGVSFLYLSRKIDMKNVFTLSKK